jgi:molybdate transport system substrate-binding protein
VLWARNDAHLDIAKGLNSLTSDDVKKIAIANPAHAPYGRAAEAALKSAGIYDRVSSKLVLGENISQTALFAQSGNADAGIIALSLALNPTMKTAGHYFEIPTSEYPSIRQGAVIMKNSQQIDLAKRFVAFLGGNRAMAILQQFGFSVKK